MLRSGKPEHIGEDHDKLYRDDYPFYQCGIDKLSEGGYPERKKAVKDISLCGLMLYRRMP